LGVIGMAAFVWDGVDGSRATLRLNGVKLAEHRRDVLIRFRIGTKLHPIANDAGQVLSDLQIGCASFEHLKDCWRVAVILVHGFGNASHANRVPSPEQDNSDHPQFRRYVHHASLDGSANVRYWANCLSGLRKGDRANGRAWRNKLGQGTCRPHFGRWQTTMRCSKAAGHSSR
jgi:hypothetical protein